MNNLVMCLELRNTQRVWVRECEHEVLVSLADIKSAALSQLCREDTAVESHVTVWALLMGLGEDTTFHHRSDLL